MSEIVAVNKVVGTTIVIDLKESGNDDTYCLTLELGSAHELMDKLYEVLKYVPSPSETVVRLQEEATTMFNTAITSRR